MIMRSILLTLDAATAVLLTAGGCSSDPANGYSFKSPYRTNIQTVAVPIWARGKDVYRREHEKRLTEAICKRIELDTPYKVTEKSRADTMLEGSLDQIDQRVMSYNPDSGMPRELEITFIVSFTWTDLRTGKVILRKTRMPMAVSYIPEGAFNEDFFQGSEDVDNRLARRIVELLEIDW